MLARGRSQCGGAIEASDEDIERAMKSRNVVPQLRDRLSVPSVVFAIRGRVLRRDVAKLAHAFAGQHHRPSKLGLRRRFSFGALVGTLKLLRQGRHKSL